MHRCHHVPDLLRNINDPEHPLTLEQLNVAQLQNIFVDNENSLIRVRECCRSRPDLNTYAALTVVLLMVLQVHFTPTIPHCSMATLIGLCLRVKLLRSLPKRFKVGARVSADGLVSLHGFRRDDAYAMHQTGGHCHHTRLPCFRSCWYLCTDRIPITNCLMTLVVVLLCLQ